MILRVDYVLAFNSDEFCFENRGFAGSAHPTLADQVSQSVTTGFYDDTPIFHYSVVVESPFACPTPMASSQVSSFEVNL